MSIYVPIEVLVEEGILRARAAGLEVVGALVADFFLLLLVGVKLSFIDSNVNNFFPDLDSMRHIPGEVVDDGGLTIGAIVIDDDMVELCGDDVELQTISQQLR